MASTILYKFRSGTSFEPLPMPGNAARLFDVKRAIVKAKRLDRSSNTSGPQLEFDLSVKNANTHQEYTDETAILPRGTRVVVQRLPAARGHGLLARIARAEAGMAQGGLPAGGGHGGGPASSGFYTISSRERDDEEEFVSADPPPTEEPGGGRDEEKELAALMAVTEQAGGTFRPGAVPATGAAGSATHANKVWAAGQAVPPPLPPPQGGLGGANHGRGPGGHFQQNRHHHHHHHRERPNADPELREQEMRTQPKKRATGIPRTFLDLSAPPTTDKPTFDGVADGEEPAEVDAGGLSRLQPNALGFRELVNRGGGRSGTGTDGQKRDLDYALKLTLTDVPDYLQCGICHKVVKNAMLLPWDTEGRTACETCIRDALAQGGFRCPLTGQEGVSPDDLHPNYGLRKAADKFVKGVMEKMEEIEGQKEDEQEENQTEETPGASGYEAGGGDKGVVLTKKAAAAAARDAKKKSTDDDLFGEDDFGGDVFDVGDEASNNDGGDNDAEEDDEADMFGADDEKGETDQPGTDAATTGKAEKDETNAPGTAKEVDTEDNLNKTPDEKEQKEEESGGNKGSSGGNNRGASKSLSQTNGTPEADASDAGTPSKLSNTAARTPAVSSPQPQPRRSHSPRGSAQGAARRGARGPPLGYAMGPFGGAKAAAEVATATAQRSPPKHGGAPPARSAHAPPASPASAHPPPPPPPVQGGGDRGPPPQANQGRGAGGGGYTEQQPQQYHHQTRPPFRGGRGGGGPAAARGSGAGRGFYRDGGGYQGQSVGGPADYSGGSGRGYGAGRGGAYNGTRADGGRGSGRGGAGGWHQQHQYHAQDTGYERQQQRGMSPNPSDGRGTKRPRTNSEDQHYGPVSDDRLTSGRDGATSVQYSRGGGSGHQQIRGSGGGYQGDNIGGPNRDGQYQQGWGEYNGDRRYDQRRGGGPPPGGPPVGSYRGGYGGGRGGGRSMGGGNFRGRGFGGRGGRY